MKCFPRQQKRSAFMALLPTPPRTYRRYKRGCSRGDYDSESDDFGNQGQALPSTDEEGAELQRLCIKRRRSLSKGDDEEVFWLAGPKSDTISEGFGLGEGTDALSSAVPLWYRILWSNRNQRLEKSNRWIFQSSQIHLITLSIWHHFSMWVLKHLVTPTMRSPLWHMFCELFISAEGYVASIRICSTITRKPASFTSSHIWRTILFPNAPKGKYKRVTPSWCGHLKRFETEPSEDKGWYWR